MQALDKMGREWEVASLQVLEYRETGTYVIKVSGQALGQMAGQGPRNSRHGHGGIGALGGPAMLPAQGLCLPAAPPA